MNPKIVVIAGWARSGKDTFVNQLIKNDNSIYYWSTIDPFKSFLESGLSLRYNGSPEMRELLSDLKSCVLKYSKTHFIYMIEEYIETHLGKFSHIVTQMREKDQLDLFKNHFRENVILVYITRPNKKDESITVLEPNIGSLWQYIYVDFDVLIENDGSIEDLQKKADEFYKEYLAISTPEIAPMTI
jgi:hypothetical protein